MRQNASHFSHPLALPLVLCSYNLRTMPEENLIDIVTHLQ